MKRIIAVLFVVALVFTMISGCATTQGTSPAGVANAVSYVTPWINTAAALAPTAMQDVQLVCQGSTSKECGYANLAALLLPLATSSAQSIVAAVQQTPTAANIKALNDAMIPVYTATKQIVGGADAPLPSK